MIFNFQNKTFLFFDFLTNKPANDRIITGNSFVHNICIKKY